MHLVGIAKNVFVKNTTMVVAVSIILRVEGNAVTVAWSSATLPTRVGFVKPALIRRS